MKQEGRQVRQRRLEGSLLLNAPTDVLCMHPPGDTDAEAWPSDEADETTGQQEEGQQGEEEGDELWRRPAHWKSLNSLINEAVLALRAALMQEENEKEAAAGEVEEAGVAEEAEEGAIEEDKSDMSDTKP